MPAHREWRATGGGGRPRGRGSGFQLADLGGETERLHEFRWNETLLLFSTRLRLVPPDGRPPHAWDASRGSGTREILVVSTGTVDANGELGVKARMVLDQSFTVASSLGSNGTPMAVLLDADGNIASVAAGAPSVLALAPGEQPAAT